MNTLFPPRLRAASVVSRWSIVHCLRHDNIAEHSWFVVVYSSLVAEVIGWNGPMYQLTLMAALHDADELVTGDIVAPVKHRVVDDLKMNRFVRSKMGDTLSSVLSLADKATASVSSKHRAEIKAIIKVADALDALFKATVEELSGNKIIAARVADCRRRLMAAWSKLPADSLRLNALYREIVEPSIEAHTIGGNHDIGEYSKHDADAYTPAYALGTKPPKTRKQAVGRSGRGSASVKRQNRVGPLS